jgi:homoserine O-acetyltransferase
MCFHADRHAGSLRNPPETGVTKAALKRIGNAQLLLIPASTETRGHGTTAQAKFYVKELREFLDAAPKRAM